MNELSQRSPSTPCPLCLHGAIATMPMMDCLACNFCSHIFILEQSADQRHAYGRSLWRSLRGALRDRQQI